MRKSLILWVLVIFAVAPARFALAQPGDARVDAAQASSSDSQESRLARLEQEAAEAKSSADNVWMLTSSALVLMMTGPGLALFYGGLVRKKNVLGTMMQSFALMALITVLWAVVGYSLCFGSGNSFVGGLENVFLHHVTIQPNVDYSTTIPEQTFMVYQLMFAIITPALITGAFAERMKFSAMVAFLVLWSILVYAPMAHMVWGKGGLLNVALGGRFPTLDFAGGTVVHITSGVSALVCALYMGKRLGYPNTPMPPHSGTKLCGSFAAVGRLVWLQCRQRSRLRGSGYQCVRSHPFWSIGSRGRMERNGMVAKWETECVRRHLRCGRRSGGDYTCLRIRESAFGARHWTCRGGFLLHNGREGEGPLWL
jgi:hypothetical protein